MGQVEASSVVLEGRTLVIRTAVEADAPALHEFFRTVYGETEFLSRYRDEVPDAFELVARRVKGHLEAEKALFLVATVDEHIVALANLAWQDLRHFNHAAELAISVLKDFWGLGIGRRLMQLLSDWAESCGLLRVQLEVAATNERAIRMYRAFGFVVEGRLHAQRKHGDTFVDGLVMARVRPEVTSVTGE
jgi:ribosomal protein S18 acetylase RimI-like enzyme